MKEKLKENKGITLIALVITIILLLILAGVTINIALGDNGLFKKSRQAVERSKLAQVEEDIKMDLLSAYLEAEIEGKDKPSNERIKEIIESHGGTIDESNPNIIKLPNGEIRLDEVLSETSTNTQDVEELKKQIANLNNQIKELQGKQATGNAEEGDVLEGRTFSTANGLGLTGTMVNRGLLNFNPPEQTTQTVEPGYYEGGTISNSETLEKYGVFQCKGLDGGSLYKMEILSTTPGAFNKFNIRINWLNDEYRPILIWEGSAGGAAQYWIGQHNSAGDRSMGDDHTSYPPVIGHLNSSKHATFDSYTDSPIVYYVYRNSFDFH